MPGLFISLFFSVQIIVERPPEQCYQFFSFELISNKAPFSVHSCNYYHHKWTYFLLIQYRDHFNSLYEEGKKHVVKVAKLI